MTERSLTAVFLYLMSFLAQSDSKVPFFLKINYCTSPECERIGTTINGYLNQSVDPCENFYQFSCGGWTSKVEKPQSEPIWSNWQILASRINDRIEDILNFEPKSDNIGLKKASKFYNACMDSSAMENKYLNNLRLLIKDIRGWPIVQENVNLSDYNWFRDNLKISRLLGVHPIFKVGVNIDYKNTSVYALYVEPGDLIYPSYILNEPKKYPVELKSYKFWIFQTIRHLYKNKMKRNMKQDVSKIIQFEAKLANMNERSKNERITFAMLTKKFPYDWKRAFHTITLNENLKFKDNDTLIIKNFSYFKNVFNFLQKIDPTIIANYLMWYAVKDLSRETGPHMRLLNFMVDKSVLGIKSDITKRTECLNEVNKYFQNALVPLYTERYLNPKTLEIVTEIVDNIRIEFIKLIKRSYWLNEHTKNLAIDKIKYLKEYIGYPVWTKNLTALNDYYNKVNITSNHFHNVVNLKNFLTEKELRNLKKSVQEIIWPSGPLEVNAYYSILQNAIFIPLGILEPPFFNLNVPEALNYGALGSLIGHEISHALDMSGRQANKYGNIGKWWIEEDILKYEKRAECYENFYNSLDVNGRLTIGENIADNVGIDISFSAMKKLKSSKVFTMIPNLETFSNEQLFFLAYSQMWCEISEKTELFMGDEHAPVESRVIGTLHNEDFHENFHCDTVNKQYCRLW